MSRFPINPLAAQILQSIELTSNTNHHINNLQDDYSPTNDPPILLSPTFINENRYLTPTKRTFLQQQFREKVRLPLNYEFEDLNCLCGRQWINDAVLNSYLSYCYNKIDENDARNIGLTNSFFLKSVERDGFKRASCWQGIKGQPINKYDLFLIPICCGSHWILAAIDFINHEIRMYDSFHGAHHDLVNLINGFLKFQGIEPLDSVIPDVPTQYNGYDCGVFVMEFGRCILLEKDINSFSQKDMPATRKRIYNELSSLL